MAIILLTLGLITSSLSSIAFASNYGAGSYNSCSFQNDCLQPPAPTTIQTPTGLQVAINLTNGQSIPINGYTIVITPLNGQGASFQQAAIYINSVLSQTITPTQTGTASWAWVPDQVGSTDVKVIITDTNGTTSTQDFTVIVTGPTTSAGVASGVLPKHHATVSASKSGISALVNTLSATTHRIVATATKAVKKLPKPIIHTFPYILFLLLGIDVIVILAQAQRELSQYRALQLLLDRAQKLDETKRTFLELVSHYLRTPITIITGGIELIAASPSIAAPLVSGLATIAQDMNTKINGIITGLNANKQSTVYTDPVSAQHSKLWRQPGLFLPILLIAAAWLSFNYLADRAGNFSVGQIEQLGQIIVFTAVALIAYMAFRYRQIGRRNKRELQYIMANEEAIGRTSDDLVTTTITTLNTNLASLDQLMAQLNPTPQTKTVIDGQKRLHELLARFSVTEAVRGAHSDQPFIALELQKLVALCTDSLQTKITDKHLTISIVGQTVFMTQEPDLYTYVVSSIIDNAVAYSPANGSIILFSDQTTHDFKLTISDQGPGIASDKLPLLFKPFSKTETAESFDHEGMGFSLYLDRLIMTYLGGSIELDAKPNQGTTVVLHLPQPDQA
jgi:signal transduction histidine kinase